MSLRRLTLMWISIYFAQLFLLERLPINVIFMNLRNEFLSSELSYFMSINLLFCMLTNITKLILACKNVELFFVMTNLNLST